eukprot:CAMPEP_0194343674 /NCGR_PEP_ID=MMETSP0171-20130528/98096_1 /TAXON_ID=218684 /ORGANISM="Corethron pennatum, Strain L29A3" /LENGTH=231 /DNA_ID=CAMNT_0039109999 /DNA_START=68 /DNA_END=759 /DNA_ORIENTATION=+
MVRISPSVKVGVRAVSLAPLCRGTRPLRAAAALAAAGACILLVVRELFRIPAVALPPPLATVTKSLAISNRELNALPLRQALAIVNGAGGSGPLPHSSNSGTSHFDLPDLSPVLRLPTPVLVVGFPKSGTTSVWSYFHCGGIPSSHETCGQRHDGSRWVRVLCGTCISHNVARGAPPLTGCGNYAVWAEMNVSVKDGDPPHVYLPQVTELDALHAAYPRATLVLNLRDADG